MEEKYLIVLDEVCRVYGIESAEILKSKGRAKKDVAEARQMFIYISIMMGVKGAEITRFIGRGSDQIAFAKRRMAIKMQDRFKRDVHSRFSKIYGVAGKRIKTAEYVANMMHLKRSIIEEEMRLQKERVKLQKQIHTQTGKDVIVCFEQGRGLMIRLAGVYVHAQDFFDEYILK